MQDEQELRTRIAQAARAVRDANPMAASITNAVTMNFVANAQIAVGGSAAMVYLAEEGEALAQAGCVMYLNMGTLLPLHEESMTRTARAAHEGGTPWVLDPVGLGIGELRTRILAALKDSKPAIIRANASEVMGLAGLWGLLGAADDVARARGVDSTDEVAAAREAACALARHTGGAVAVSGETDLVTDGTRIAQSFGGSPLMSKITGSGCALGGVCAVFATQADPFVAALAATQAFNLAGRRAAARAAASGSFQAAFLDELFTATPEEVAANPFTIEEA